MAQWVNHLPCKHEDPSLDPQNIPNSFGEWKPETEVSKAAYGADNRESAVENRGWVSNKVKNTD